MKFIVVQQAETVGDSAIIQTDQSVAQFLAGIGATQAGGSGTGSGSGAAPAPSDAGHPTGPHDFRNEVTGEWFDFDVAAQQTVPPLNPPNYDEVDSWTQGRITRAELKAKLQVKAV